MWITTTTGKYFYDPHTDGEVPVIGQDWILPSGDNLGRVQSVGVLRQNTEGARHEHPGRSHHGRIRRTLRHLLARHTNL